MVHCSGNSVKVKVLMNRAMQGDNQMSKGRIKQFEEYYKMALDECFYNGLQYSTYLLHDEIKTTTSEEHIKALNNAITIIEQEMERWK